MPTFLHHHLHHGHSNEFTQILRSRNLRAFAFGIARVFIPLFLITVYGGLEEALWPITVFILSGYGLRLLLIPQYAALVIKLGAKHAMSVSFVSGVVALLMTAYLQTNLWYIAALGFFLGAANALFFLAYHIDLALTLKKTKAVKHGIGSVEMIRKIVLALGPLFGGIVATQISEKALFVAAAAFMVMAISALYLKEDDVLSHNTNLNLGSLKIYRKYWRDFVANFAMGINVNAASFLWSILLFVVIGTYQAVGFVLAISLVMSLVIITFTRRHDSAKSDRKEIRGGSTATSAIHMARPFVETASMAAGVNFFNDIAYSFLYVPYVDRYYKRIRKKDGMTYVTVMEVAAVLGHLVMWLSFTGLFVVLGQNSAFIGAFALAAVAALFVRLISRE